MTMEILLILGLLLAFVQFVVFLYLHRYQLGLAKSPAPQLFAIPRTRSFLEQHGFGIYIGLCVGVALMKLAQRYDWEG